MAAPPSRVVCLGEAIVDLVPTTRSGPAEATGFVKAAGGAPANVAVGLARLGVAAGFIGCVGADGFGRFLGETLAREGVDVTGLRRTAAAPTALAVVSHGPDAERDFIFYGHPAAHTLLADIDADAIGKADILHVGSLSLAAEPARTATLHALDVALANGLDVSCDPNLRLPLWPDADRARDAMRQMLGSASLVKISEEEVDFISDGRDLVARARALWHPRLRLMAVTRGGAGCLWLTPDAWGEQPGFTVEAVDATGAGDAFTAALLAGLVDRPILAPAAVAAMVRTACAAGALATTRAGAMAALPRRPDLEQFLRGAADPG